MDGLCHQLLPRAAFPRDQHGKIVAQDAGDHPEHALHGRAAPDQRQGVVIVRSLILGRGSARNRLRHGLGELIKIERFGKILERIAVARPDCGIQRVLRREDDHRHIGGLRAHGLDRRQTVAILQNHIGQHDVETTLGQKDIALGNTLAPRHIEAIVAQRLGDDRRYALIVFDQQNRVRHEMSYPAATGRLIRKWVSPARSSRSCDMRPPMSRNNLRTRARPRPCP